jgi:D-serine deaminase-like pyridoxal phosphate-dependent protein
MAHPTLTLPSRPPGVQAPGPAAASPAAFFARLDTATADLDPPLAAVDLAAFDANASDLARRAGGLPVRVATKSVRCRHLLERALALPGFRGVMAHSLAEALWLARGPGGLTDVLVGYPSAERRSLGELASDELAASRVTLMVDSPHQLDLVDSVAPPSRRPPIRVCLDVDASLRIAGGRVHLGVRRSPVHLASEAEALARLVAGRRGFSLVGVMAYEAQIAGVGDRPPGQPLRALAVRVMQAASAAELARRREAVVGAVSKVARLEMVNGGGTGSLERTAADPAVTDLTAGSGLFGPALFDHYRAFRPHPAALFALPVVRRPDRGTVTVAGGGWVASGPAGPDRLPVPVWPEGIQLLRAEGAGEVQTPLRGAGVESLRVGDRVWFRHAKAGELCEHVSALHLVGGGEAQAVPTYRGEGQAFV